MKNRVYFIEKRDFFIDSGEYAHPGNCVVTPNAYSSIEAAERALQGLVKKNRKTKIVGNEPHVIYGEREWPSLNIKECFQIKDCAVLDEHDIDALERFREAQNGKI